MSNKAEELVAALIDKPDAFTGQYDLLTIHRIFRQTTVRKVSPGHLLGNSEVQLKAHSAMEPLTTVYRAPFPRWSIQ